jgi:hypothetical protein
MGADSPRALDAMYWELKCHDVESDEPYVSGKNWQNAKNCEVCNRGFSYLSRRHHCRVCSR